MAQPAVKGSADLLEVHTGGSSVGWPVIGALVLGTILTSILFHREIRAAVEVWNASTAYSHCYLVLPMAFYLLWERRDVLATCRAQPELRLAVGAVPLTVIWLAAERLGIMEARQLVVIAGFELLLVAIFGRRLYSLASGPLLFLFFLVPFGAFLTPALQQFTAAFSILGLDLLGIPNYSDKFTIETPAGIFFVAEACAGLRFLIAAIAFGVFYSLLSYTSLTRRIGFIAASIVVPILANGVRALGIVILGQVLGSAEAAAADHLVYGWLFFSVVMLLLIAGGHPFRQEYDPAMVEPVSGPALASRSPLWCAIGVVLLLGLGPAVAGAIDSRAVAPVLPNMATIVAPAGCSSRADDAETSSYRQTFSILCDAVRFEVSVSAFPERSTSSAMTSQQRRVTQEIGAENAAVSIVEMPDRAGHWTVVQTIEPNRLTAYAGWVDGMPVPNGLAGRAAQARNSVFGAAYVPALITITTVEPANSPPAKRKQTLETLTRLLSAQTNLSSKMTALTSLNGK